MGKEPLRRRRRREMAHRLRSSEAGKKPQRRELTPEEATVLLEACDKNQQQRFGLVKLAKVCVDSLHVPPTYKNEHGGAPLSAWAPKVTLIAYAAHRHRACIVAGLYRAGADPSVRHPVVSMPGSAEAAPAGDVADVEEEEEQQLLRTAGVREHLATLPQSYAAYIIMQVVAMRRAGELAVAAAAAAAEAPAKSASSSAAACSLCNSVGYGQQPLQWTASATAVAAAAAAAGSGSGHSDDSDDDGKSAESCSHMLCEPCFWAHHRRHDGALGEMPCPVCSSTASEAAPQLVPPPWVASSRPADWPVLCKRCDSHSTATDEEEEEQEEEEEEEETKSPAAAEPSRTGHHPRTYCPLVDTCGCEAARAGRAAASRARWLRLPVDQKGAAQADAAARAARAAASAIAAAADAASAGDSGGGETKKSKKEKKKEKAAMAKMKKRSGASRSGKPKFEALPRRAAAGLSCGFYRPQRVDALLTAAAAGDVVRLQAVVDRGVDVDAANECGETAAMVAARCGQARALACLAWLGASLDVPEHGGVTPAAAAAARGHPEALAVLQQANGRSAVDGVAPGAGTKKATATESTESESDGDEKAGECGDDEEEKVRMAPASALLALAAASAGTTGATVHELIPSDADHPGAGSFYIDGAFSDEFMRHLDDLWHRVPAADIGTARDRGYGQTCARRNFFCDADGAIEAAMAPVALAAFRRGEAEASRRNDDRVTAAGKDGGGGGGGGDDDDDGAAGQDRLPTDAAGEVESAGAAAAATALPSSVRVMPRMRFLHYPDVGGEMRPHVDLAKKDMGVENSKHSTHTFLLHLADCASGGETVLLKSLSAAAPAVVVAAAATAAEPAGDGSSGGGGGGEEAAGGVVAGGLEVLASVAPRRGRLFVFPHMCPHAGLPVKDVPKLFLRGELLLLSSMFSQPSPWKH